MAKEKAEEIAKPLLTNIEDNELNISLEKLKAIEKLAGVTPEDLKRFDEMLSLSILED